MSKGPWSEKKCILCCQQGEMTSEHIIPRFLSGKLELSFLCRPCNSHFGQILDYQAKHDPAIKVAVENISRTLPGVAAEFYEGLKFDVEGTGPATTATFKKGRLKTDAKAMPDGSLIQHTSEARKNLHKFLAAEGLSAKEINKAINKFDEGPENVPIKLSEGHTIVKWSVSKLRLHLAGSSASRLWPVKMAYEFLAVHLGNSIYSEHLEPIRKALKTDTASDFFTVEQGYIPPYCEYHGLALVSADPCVVAIRLFGAVRYKVHFPYVGFVGPRLCYDLNLETGKEVVYEMPNSTTTD